MSNYEIARRGAGLSLQDAADRIGTSVSTLASWERGETAPRADKIAQMVTVYGCSADELLGLTERE